MAAPEKNYMMVAAFAASVICCLIGTGVFLHLATSTIDEQQEQETNLAQRLQEEENASQALKKKLVDLEEEMSQKKRLLEAESTQNEASRKGEEELRRLESMAARFGEIILSVNRKIAILRGQLDSLQKEHAESGVFREDTRRKLEAANAEHRRLVSERNALLQKSKENQKVYSVTSLNEGGALRTRPAVFVECRANEVIVQPLGKRFNFQKGNEEEAAFLTMVKSTRYVVFLIRPDGFESFRRYRNLVLSKNRLTKDPVDIGFEPVNGDWILTYPGERRQTFAKGGEL